MLLALAPDLVRQDLAEPGNTAGLAELLPVLTTGGVAAASPNGILGDPTGADAVEGEAYLDLMVDTLREQLARWEPDERGRLT